MKTGVAIHHRRLFVFPRNLVHETLEQPNREGHVDGCVEQYHPQVGIRQAEIAKHEIHGNRDGDGGHHPCRQYKEHQIVAERDLEAREGVGRQGAGAAVDVELGVAAGAAAVDLRSRDQLLAALDAVSGPAAAEVAALALLSAAQRVEALETFNASSVDLGPARREDAEAIRSSIYQGTVYWNDHRHPYVWRKSYNSN